MMIGKIHNIKETSESKVIPDILKCSLVCWLEVSVEKQQHIISINQLKLHQIL